MERRARWSFGFRTNDTWFWRVTLPDGKERYSEEGIETLADCLWDAMAHGYAVWEPGVDRRHEPAAQALE
jgi:hypothetical protein